MADMVLVDETLDWIILNPERWNNLMFTTNTRTHGIGGYTLEEIKVPIANECGTTFCFAGVALMLRGRLKYVKDTFFNDDTWYVEVMDEDGNTGHSFGATARKLLKLTEDEAFAIFYDYVENEDEDEDEDEGEKGADPQKFRAYVYKVLGVTKD